MLSPFPVNRVPAYLQKQLGLADEVGLHADLVQNFAGCCGVFLHTSQHCDGEGDNFEASHKFSKGRTPRVTFSANACGFENTSIGQLGAHKIRVKVGWLLALIGLDAADKVREAAQHLVHQICQGILELGSQRRSLAVGCVGTAVRGHDFSAVNARLQGGEGRTLQSRATLKASPAETPPSPNLCGCFIGEFQLAVVVDLRIEALAHQINRGALRKEKEREIDMNHESNQGL